MEPPTPYQESSSRTLPAPYPTHPVAGRPVESDAPTFDWTPVPDATHYRVQIADSEAFESIYYDETTARQTALSLNDVLPDDAATACWRVRAETDDSKPSSWSDPAHFARSAPERATDAAAVRVDAPPVPLHPTDDSPADRAAVPFSWESVPEASGYQLQVAANEDFADPTVDLTFDQTTSVTLCEMLSPEHSPFYWRIRPLFRVADPGPWSAPVPFTVGQPPEEEQDLAPEAEDPESSARAAGPVEHARTSRGLSLAVSLIAVLTFIATILLVALVS